MGKFKLTKTKILAAVLALAFVPTLVGAQLSPVLDTTGLYQIANRSISANWGTSTTADPGQTLDFMVHIHNTVYNTTANNVRVQVALPISAVTSYDSRATVSADNASPVSATTSFTLSTESTVTYVPGSTLLYDHNDKLVGTLPDGIAGSGVKVSDGIQGCFANEEWVIFKAKVTEKVTPKKGPECILTASPNKIVTGGSSTLTWSTKNAESFSINQGIGKESKLNGNSQVSPKTTITYTGTVIGEGGKANCNTTVTVTTPTPKPTPTPTPTPTPVTPTTPIVTASTTTPALPVTGPADAAAGIFATVGIGGAGYAYRKSLVKLKNSFKKF